MERKISIEELSSKPAFSLTAGEMAEIIVSKLNITHLKEPIKLTSERKKINGIQGLANYISCSPTTAQKLKSSGILGRFRFTIWDQRSFFTLMK